jgi:hypothetical protein
MKSIIFSLRFPIKEIDRWASQYAYEDDEPILAIGEDAKSAAFTQKKNF